MIKERQKREYVKTTLVKDLLFTAYTLNSFLEFFTLLNDGRHQYPVIESCVSEFLDKQLDKLIHDPDHQRVVDTEDIKQILARS